MKHDSKIKFGLSTFIYTGIKKGLPAPSMLSPFTVMTCMDGCMNDYIFERYFKLNCLFHLSQCLIASKFPFIVLFISMILRLGSRQSR